MQGNVSVDWTAGMDHRLGAVAGLLVPSCPAAGAGERECATAAGEHRMAADDDGPFGDEIERDPCADPSHGAGGSMILALITASAAVLPSTAACPRNLHTLSFFCCLTTLMRNWSPGTTGRRNRA